MKILVTGAGGRIGGAVCRHLAPRHQVTGLDRLAAPGVQVVGDVADADCVAAALDGVQAVVHTAALHAPHVGQLPDAEFERINVAATVQLQRLATQHGVRALVFTSTTALYGEANTSVGRASWIREDTPAQPRTIYHRSKLAAERLLAEAAMHGGPALRVIRMSRCFPEAAPLMAVYRLHRGVDARDVAEAHALALQHALDEPGVRVDRFIVSGATPFVLSDAPALAQDAGVALKGRAPELLAAFAQRGWPCPDSIDRVYDPGRAASVLGWRARHGWDEVLRQLDSGGPDVLPPGN